MHVLGLGLGHSLQYGVSFDVCCIWISWERMGFVPALCDGEVGRVQQEAEQHLVGIEKGWLGESLVLSRQKEEIAEEVQGTASD